MFKKILIANRGEIALRVINTCKEMGVETVAVYSEVDEKAIHVLCSDEAVCIGASEPSESYLNIDKIIRAAKDTHCQAIHPGYGFLAENYEFAKRCEREGIVFIGPGSKAIKDLGDKITSRKLMVKGNVPVTPGLTSTEADVDVMAAEAKKVGYPVLIKATAGGGGKGIRIVNSPDEMADACASASREALNAFGNTIHVLERECSIQRRHQKIIEETPANDFFPLPGKIEFLKEPKGPGIRNDCGAYTGVDVPVDYDPIISKLVVHAQARAQAIDKMIKALKEYIILGIRTPIDFLLDVLMSEPFSKGDVFTNFIETHFSDWEENLNEKNIAAIAYILDELCNRRTKTDSLAHAAPTPFNTLGNWRL